MLENNVFRLMCTIIGILALGIFIVIVEREFNLLDGFFDGYFELRLQKY